MGPPAEFGIFSRRVLAICGIKTGTRTRFVRPLLESVSKLRTEQQEADIRNLICGIWSIWRDINDSRHITCSSKEDTYNARQAGAIRRLGAGGQSLAPDAKSLTARMYDSGRLDVAVQIRLAGQRCASDGRLASLGCVLVLPALLNFDRLCRASVGCAQDEYGAAGQP